LPKITDPSYFLPRVFATEAGRVLASGRTRPMLIRGVCLQNNEKGDYVVKLKGSPEMYADASMKELLGSFIATELDLYTPGPASIELTPELMETMEDHGNFLFAGMSLGLNFGTSLQTGFQEVLQGQAISTGLYEKLYDVFAFDTLIANPDRRIDKPNFLSNGKDILIFDHELAFSFLHVLPFLQNHQPWLIPNAEMNWISTNYCFALLKGQPRDFATFITRMERLDNSFWNKAESLIPQEWKTANFEVIRGHIDSIVANRQIFASELNRILSP
jgi:hypothetical protein